MLLDRDLTAWANEFLLAPDEPPPSVRLPLVFSLPPPSSPPRHEVNEQDAVEQDLSAWEDEFLLAPDAPPPSLPLPLVFSLPPATLPPRRHSEIPVAA